MLCIAMEIVIRDFDEGGEFTDGSRSTYVFSRTPCRDKKGLGNMLHLVRTVHASSEDRQWSWDVRLDLVCDFRGHWAPRANLGRRASLCDYLVWVAFADAHTLCARRNPACWGSSWV